MGVAIEPDRPPAGTPCARCKELGHFCLATEYIEDTDEAQCISCLEAEDCEVVRARKTTEEVDVFTPPPVRKIAPPVVLEVDPFVAIVERIMRLDPGEVVRFRPPTGTAIYQYQLDLHQRLAARTSEQFLIQKTGDGIDVLVSRAKKKGLIRMAQPVSNGTDNSPRSSKVAERGIKTARDFVDFMSALMADVVSDRVAPQKAAAACQAAGKMLQVVEMQHRYSPSGTDKPLELIPAQKQLENGQ